MNRSINDNRYARHITYNAVIILTAPLSSAALQSPDVSFYSDMHVVSSFCVPHMCAYVNVEVVILYRVQFEVCVNDLYVITSTARQIVRTACTISSRNRNIVSPVRSSYIHICPYNYHSHPHPISQENKTARINFNKTFLIRNLTDN